MPLRGESARARHHEGRPPRANRSLAAESARAPHILNRLQRALQCKGRSQPVRLHMPFAGLLADRAIASSAPIIAPPSPVASRVSARPISTVRWKICLVLAAILVAAAQLMLFVFAPFERGGHIDFARSRLLYTMWRSPFGERVISNNYSKQALPEAWMNDDAPAWLNEQQDASGYFRQESGWPFRAFVAQLRYEPYEDRVLSIQDWNLHRTSRPKLLNGEPALFLPSRIL